MRKKFLLRPYAILFFLALMIMPVHAIKPTTAIEFNSFLGVIGIPEGYEIECECGKIDGKCCDRRLKSNCCMYINKITNEQFIVGVDCAKDKFQLAQDVHIPREFGINKNVDCLDCKKIEIVNDFKSIKVLKYFFNMHNWNNVENGFVINLEKLYDELGIQCDEKNLNIEEIGPLQYKINYLNKDFFVPTFSVCEGTEGNDKLLVEFYVAYDKFCRCHKIDDSVYKYCNIRFDSNLNKYHKMFW